MFGAAVAAAAVLLELIGVGHRLPQRRRLVPQAITLGNRRSAALQFGFEMGTGFRTLSPSALPLASLALLVLVGSWLAAIAVAIAFAFGRAITPSVRHAAGVGFGWEDGWWAARRSINGLFAVALAVVSARVLSPLFA
jgi:hypothetical protein